MSISSKIVVKKIHIVIGGCTGKLRKFTSETRSRKLLPNKIEHLMEEEEFLRCFEKNAPTYNGSKHY